MRAKISITKKTKYLTQDDFLSLFQDFINDSYNGKRTKKNGAKISPGSVKNYEYLQQHLKGFTENREFELRLYLVHNLNQRELERANNYNKRFYKLFTNYLYKERNVFDNYLGTLIKCLKTFYNYVKDERSIPIGTFHKLFYVPVEEIPIITLNNEQLNYFIKNETFHEQAKELELEDIKDIFVFGCTVALRVSDLLGLSKQNLIIQGDKYYITVRSQKTKTVTSIKLPDYAIEILKKYEKNKGTALLPQMSIAWFNTRLKRLASLIPDDFTIVKTRQQKGKDVIVYKDVKQKTHYKLSDHITTHTMRRTAITTMLSLGMPEHVVRKISGHAPNSKEFFRYVKLAQSFLDDETDRVFDKLLTKN